ncbi:deoxyribonuclease-2-beta isoform X4 [Ovis canadensis]|uniref:deoxyribonuclease-2-beta isoform X4 n=1 Tax=Ovis canadensis TaxID=37174 RepID=UPI0037515D24
MTARLLGTPLTVLFLGLFGILKATKISCRNEEGEAVDWFIFYKLPKKQNQESRETGLEYLYLDSTTRSWSRSKQLMNASTSVLGRTLQQLYEASASENNSTAYLIYNDGVPKSVNYSRKYGHTKVPEEGYDYPPTGRRNGQAGICITFKYNQYEAIDIFAAWMAQQLKTHLLTETWQRKRQELPSNCSLPHHVYNIKAIKISRHSYFSSYQDHAKWCISRKGTKNRWTCIGDLNRSPYQVFRSGGFICTQNQHIYRAFQGLVLYYENCN